MFGRKWKSKKAGAREELLARERFKDNEHVGKQISAGIAGLKNVARDNLAEAAFMLFMEAKHRNERIRQSIKEDAGYAFEAGGTVEGDRATYLAEEAAAALRDHAATSRSLFAGMSEQSPDAHFTIDQRDAVSMISAMIREQRLDGILEGLRLAGVLNEPTKRRPIP